MSITSQEYANLSANAYKDYPVGTYLENDTEKVVIEGVEYKILEHKNNPLTGYQGTIYQKIDEPNEIIVAHRGTENDGRDIFIDTAMFAANINLQTKDAIELTRHALEYAKQQEVCGQKPEVTVA